MNPQDSHSHFCAVVVVMPPKGTLAAMSIDRPEPGAELNTGEPTVPRQAATVIVLRGGQDHLEVLLAQRNPDARFMGGAWVFPGGAVDAADGDDDRAHRAAAVREVAEEAGMRLDDPDALVRFSRWITPEQITIRYDTHFFLAPAPEGQEARIDGSEIVDARWFTPARALEAYEAGEILLVFPTIKHLEALSRFGSADELLGWARGRKVEAVEPRVIQEGEVARIVLPGEAGYEA
jgi:8-oxo-dGTP pyrophosphatase MutT (NUDIX family)